MFPCANPSPSSSNISSEPDKTIEAPVDKPWFAWVTFIVEEPCCVANGSSSSSTNKSSFNVTVIEVALEYAVTVASVPYIFSVVPT